MGVSSVRLRGACSLALVLFFLGAVAATPSRALPASSVLPPMLPTTPVDKRLNVVISGATLSFPGYVVQTERGLEGDYIDLLGCMLEPLGYQVTFYVRPSRRAMTELLQGQADIYLPKIKQTEDAKGLSDDFYSAAFDKVYEVLLTTFENAQLLVEDRWLESKVGIVRASVMTRSLRQSQQPAAISAANFKQLMRLVVGGRIDVGLVISPHTGESFHHHQGRSMVGRTLLEHPLHFLVSQGRRKAEPDFMARINARIPVCHAVLGPQTR